tara:strand:+ start:6771 stop:7076 length:306 start_codon:yes stop_codon:yes gene_type:complete
MSVRVQVPLPAPFKLSIIRIKMKNKIAWVKIEDIHGDDHFIAQHAISHIFKQSNRACIGLNNGKIICSVFNSLYILAQALDTRIEFASQIPLPLWEDLNDV